MSEKKNSETKNLCALIQCRLVKHITIKLNETCYQQKTMSIDGLIYILMAFGEIKSRFQTFEGIVDALSSLKTVFYMLHL